MRISKKERKENALKWYNIFMNSNCNKSAIVVKRTDSSNPNICRCQFLTVPSTLAYDTEVKQKLCDLVTKDRKKHEDIWDYGCETIEDVIEKRNGHEYQASAMYSDNRIDYTAREFASIEFASVEHI